MSKLDRVFGKEELNSLAIESHSDGLILVVDDGSLLVELTLECLRDSGYGILIARNDEEAVRLYKETRPDLLICDMQMTEADHLCFVKDLQKEFPNFKAILMASYPSVVKNAFKEKASELGVVCVIERPLNVMELLVTAHLIMADRDVFHTQVRASNSSISQVRRQLSIVSAQIMPKQ